MLQKPQSPQSKEDRPPHGHRSLDAAALRSVSNVTAERGQLGLTGHPFSQTDVVKADQYSQRKVGVKVKGGG